MTVPQEVMAIQQGIGADLQGFGSSLFWIGTL
jgi:hypothetical protein